MRKNADPRGFAESEAELHHHLGGDSLRVDGLCGAHEAARNAHACSHDSNISWRRGALAAFRSLFRRESAARAPQPHGTLYRSGAPSSADSAIEAFNIAWPTPSAACSRLRPPSAEKLRRFGQDYRHGSFYDRELMTTFQPVDAHWNVFRGRGGEKIFVHGAFETSGREHKGHGASPQCLD